MSPAAVFKTCTAPSNLAPPEVVETTSTSIHFSWVQPLSDGACAITGYTLWIDDGSNGAFTEFDSEYFDGKHYLREYTATFNAEDAGKTFRFKLEAANEIGSVQSAIQSQLLAQIPSAPIEAPASDASVTSGDRIRVTWTAVTEDGSSQILSYSLEIDDGTGGDFVSVVGFAQDYLLQHFTITGLNQGTLYRLRYRCRNEIGWSEYSPIAYILAAK